MHSESKPETPHLVGGLLSANTTWDRTVGLPLLRSIQKKCTHTQSFTSRYQHNIRLILLFKSSLWSLRAYTVNTLKLRFQLFFILHTWFSSLNIVDADFTAWRCRCGWRHVFFWFLSEIWVDFSRKLHGRHTQKFFLHYSNFVKLSKFTIDRKTHFIIIL